MRIKVNPEIKRSFFSTVFSQLSLCLHLFLLLALQGANYVEWNSRNYSPLFPIYFKKYIRLQIHGINTMTCFASIKNKLKAKEREREGTETDRELLLKNNTKGKKEWTLTLTLSRSFTHIHTHTHTCVCTPHAILFSSSTNWQITPFN